MKIVLVPDPLTPLTAFGYFLYRRLGLLNGEVVILSGRKIKKPGILSNSIVNIAGGDIYKELEGMLLPKTEDNYPLRRMFNFSNLACARKPYSDNIKKFQDSMTAECDPKTLLESAEECFSICLYQKIDPFDGFPSLILPPGQKRESEIQSLPPDCQFLTLPVCHKEDILKREVISWHQIKLLEGRAALLQSARLAIVVGGPPQSGKSTFTASLTDELVNIAASLSTRKGWEGFKLSIECMTLDKGTPTLDPILFGDGHSDTGLVRYKKPWTLDLAFQGTRELIEAKRRNNIVIADLPGLTPPDEITEILAVFADASIILTNDWDKIRQWQSFFDRLGIRRIAQARSRMTQEGWESLVTTYYPREVISGRVCGLNRTVRSWDPFISCLAKVMFFDLLPSMVKSKTVKAL